MRQRYQPMLAKDTSIPFSGSDWLFEIKWDGIRAIAYVDEHLSLLSRNNIEISGQFPELEELTHLAPKTVLDGEIVIMRDKKPDIQALLSRVQSGAVPPGHTGLTASYVVFDILEKDGKSLTGLTLTERRKILAEAVRDGPHVTVSVPIEGQGEDYYRLAVAEGLEGIMAKRKDSLYQPGIRSDSWLKLKVQHSCDCIIAGYTPGQGGRGSAFGALLLGLYDEADGKIVYIGKVGTGFSDRDLSEFMKFFSKYKTDVPNFSNITEPVVWLEPILVCEVAYQNVTRDHKLRIPRFIRLRQDKNPEDCTTGQLVTGDKTSKETVTPQIEQYTGKRNFSKTTEPQGGETMQEEGKYFVIHEHHAHHLHYDLRLERDGVLKSWAVPKGIPETPGQKHLAVAVEDHPLEYGHFEGEIPKGEYGAGKVSIWDNGTYDTLEWGAEKIEIRLNGKRLSGIYVLVQFKRAGKKEWLVFKAH